MLNRIDSWGGGGWVWVRWLGREGRRTGGRHESRKKRRENISLEQGPRLGTNLSAGGWCTEGELDGVKGES